MKKIVLINHTFQLQRFYKRWLLFAEMYPDWDVTLIAPLNYKWDIKGSMIFGQNTEIRAESFDKENFHIKAVPIKENKFLGWKSDEMVEEIKRIQPDIVYHIGGHLQRSAIQCIQTVRKYLPNSKVVIFSMRGRTMNLKFPTIKSSKNIILWLMRIVAFAMRKRYLKILNSQSDAILCHFPDAVNCFREEQYCKPIYISTQVGVDSDIFHPDEVARQEIREKLNLGDTFVFGVASRFIRSKGLFEIIDALPEEGNWKCIFMGKGDDQFTNELKSRIKKRGFESKIIFAGFLEWHDMAKYWNAIDCALHVPNTTEKWEETFSLAVVQAMISGKPIIGNTNGAVPYQIGNYGILVKEGDIYGLRKQMIRVMKNPQEAKFLGEKNFQYVLNSFEIRHLNAHFNAILQDVLANGNDESLYDMVSYNENNN